MKILILLPAILGMSSMALHAGNFFGPAPFRSGSPLVTGVDGSYQATARAENVTGIFRFAYSGGSQTSAAVQNSWVFFVNGQVQRGSVVANINDSNIDGILDSLATLSNSGGNQTSSTNSAISLPLVTFNQNNNSSGSFEGKINLKNPSGAFNGSGILLPSRRTTNNIIGIGQNQVTAFGVSTDDISQIPPQLLPGAIVVTSTNYITPAGTIPRVEFKFRGVRTSITQPPASLSVPGAASGN